MDLCGLRKFTISFLSKMQMIYLILLACCFILELHEGRNHNFRRQAKSTDLDLEEKVKIPLI